MASKKTKTKEQKDERYHNKKLKLKYCDFVVDKDIKTEYLKSIAVDSTRDQVKMLLLKLDYFENKVNKKVYNFSADDVQQFLATGICYASPKSMDSATSRIGKYVDSCIEQNLGMVNNFKLFKFEKNEILNFAVIQNRFISEKQLQEYVAMLYNPDDKLILELPFLGLTHEELSLLKKSDVHYSKAELLLTNLEGEKRKIYNVPKRVLQLLSDKESVREYIANNNQKVETDKVTRNPKKCRLANTSYVFSPCSKTDLPDEPVGHMFFFKRLGTIQKLVGNLDFTLSSLKKSGIINEIEKRKKGPNDELSLEEYCKIHSMFLYTNPKDKNPNGELKVQRFMWDMQRIIKNIEKANIYTE